MFSTFHHFFLHFELQNLMIWSFSSKLNFISMKSNEFMKLFLDVVGWYRVFEILAVVYSALQPTPTYEEA